MAKECLCESCWNLLWFLYPLKAVLRSAMLSLLGGALNRDRSILLTPMRARNAIKYTARMPESKSSGMHSGYISEENRESYIQVWGKHSIIGRFDEFMEELRSRESICGVGLFSLTYIRGLFHGSSKASNVSWINPVKWWRENCLHFHIFSHLSVPRNLQGKDGLL